MATLGRSRAVRAVNNVITPISSKSPSTPGSGRAISTTPARYDIFQKVDGTLRWIETAACLDDAKARTNQLFEASPGQYFIFDPMSTDFIATGTTDEDPAEKRYEPPAFRRLRIGRATA
jgi:hypothetical protein